MSPTTSPSRAMSIVLALVICWGAITSAPFAHASGEKHVEFTFYWHNNLLTPKNTSAFGIVPPLQPPSLAPNPPAPESLFGGVVVFDDSLTTDPSPSSLEIARGRGIYVFVANDTRGAGLEFLWTVEFNAASGYGDRSTLTFKGFERADLPVREIAIVGGTGNFRLARGWVEITTYYFAGVGPAILKMVAYVFYGY